MGKDDLYPKNGYMAGYRDGSASSRAKQAYARWAMLGLCLFAIGFGIPAVMEGWAVAHGAGTAGRFTVSQVGGCGKNCEYVGDFTPTGANSPTEIGMRPMAGFDLRQVGDSAPAVSYDGEVFPRGGGDAWLRALGLLLAGVVGLGLWIWRMIWRRRHRTWLS
ncbi:hypothetical protein [Streptacidiphilus jiangxiensis]|uniref:hypothetical protein n=1 Tax=Streptacidiphilus jiangxiensis TaxID=235985 RepID=UPI0005A6FA91|nr:hypothetical protein [Streptacidiphilus jiangxiensis]